jgi:hypothetical protein
MARKTISGRGAQKLLITLYPADVKRLEEIRKTMAEAQDRPVAYAEVIRTIISIVHEEMKTDE